MGFDEYIATVTLRHLREKEWRVGQTFFNVLHEVRPDIANAVRGTRIDPFQVDDRLDEFLVYVANAWSDTGEEN